jgi:hypothetical protein
MPKATVADLRPVAADKKFALRRLSAVARSVNRVGQFA